MPGDLPRGDLLRRIQRLSDHEQETTSQDYNRPGLDAAHWERVFVTPTRYGSEPDVTVFTLPIPEAPPTYE